MKFAEDTLFEDEDYEINITPLIDVVFLLLIFFMLTTTFTDTQSIKVNLPQSQKTEATEKPTSMTVSLNQAGEIFLDNKRLASPQALANEFKKRNDKSITLIIRADKQSQHGRVVEIMDIAQSNEITKIAIAAEQKQ